MFLRQRESLSFDRSVPGKRGMDLPKLDVPAAKDTRPAHLKRSGFEALPELSEVEVIRHFTRLSKWNYGVDDGIYPLGSCTMKHNPRLNEKVAGLPGFTDSHPMAPDALVQGNLETALHPPGVAEGDHGPARHHPPAQCRRRRRAHGRHAHPGLPRGPGRQAPRDPHPRQRPRHQPRHRRHGGLRSGGTALAAGWHHQLRGRDRSRERQGPQGPEDPGARAGRRDRRRHDHEPQHRGRLRVPLQGDQRPAAQRGRPGLHGRRQHERPRGRGPSRRLRRGRHAPEPAQDHVHAPRRRRPRRRSRLLRREAPALPAGARGGARHREGGRRRSAQAHLPHGVEPPPEHRQGAHLLRQLRDPGAGADLLPEPRRRMA